jgi:hypothetical protein
MVEPTTLLSPTAWHRTKMNWKTLEIDRGREIGEDIRPYPGVIINGKRSVFNHGCIAVLIIHARTGLPYSQRGVKGVYLERKRQGYGGGGMLIWTYGAKPCKTKERRLFRGDFDIVAEPCLLSVVSLNNLTSYTSYNIPGLRRCLHQLLHNWVRPSINDS